MKYSWYVKSIIVKNLRICGVEARQVVWIQIRRQGNAKGQEGIYEILVGNRLSCCSLIAFPDYWTPQISWKPALRGKAVFFVGC